MIPLSLHKCATPLAVSRINSSSSSKYGPKEGRKEMWSQSSSLVSTLEYLEGCLSYIMCVFVSYRDDTTINALNHLHDSEYDTGKALQVNKYENTRFKRRWYINKTEVLFLLHQMSRTWELVPCCGFVWYALTIITCSAGSCEEPSRQCRRGYRKQTQWRRPEEVRPWIEDLRKELLSDT